MPVSNCEAIGGGALRCCMTGLGVFTIIAACMLIGDVVFTIPAVVIPAVFGRSTFWYWFHLAGFSAVSFGVFFNYYLAAGVDPGSVPPDFVRFAQESGERVSFCNRCDLPRPERCHHCIMCGRCVLKMDHHCPWINACVGYHNQRYFAAFLLYLLMGTAYSGLLLTHVFWLHSTASSAGYAPLRDSLQVTFTFVLVGSIFLAMVFFVGWNGYMVASNQTAIEVHGNRMRAQVRPGYRSPYDLGTVANVAEVFSDPPVCGTSARRYGMAGILWLLVPSIQRLPGDGTAFPTWDGGGNDEDGVGTCSV
jgi:hypothetical protein